MKKNWEIAEDIVAKFVSGKRTPGSGNKGIRGDVRTSNFKLVEVKQTDTSVLTIQYEWLIELEGYELTNDVCLAIFFGLTGYVYYPIGGKPEEVQWSTKDLRKDNLPKYIYTKKQIWELDELDSLKQWAKI